MTTALRNGFIGLAVLTAALTAYNATNAQPFNRDTKIICDEVTLNFKDVNFNRSDALKVGGTLMLLLEDHQVSKLKQVCDAIKIDNAHENTQVDTFNKTAQLLGLNPNEAAEILEQRLSKSERESRKELNSIIFKAQTGHSFK